MPYVRITEEDINPLASFDTIQNAVLMFGFNFSAAKSVENIEKSVTEPKLYTSISTFYDDLGMKPENNFIDGAVMRPYITATECLVNGLPVIYYPLDSRLDIDTEPAGSVPDERDGISAIGNYPQFSGANTRIYDQYYNSEATSEGLVEQRLIIDYSKPVRDFVPYELLSAGDSLPKPSVHRVLPVDSYDYYSYEYDEDVANNTIWKKLGIPAAQADFMYDQYHDNQDKHLAESALDDLLDDGRVLFTDRVNLPFTFITTCGYDTFGDTNIVDKVIEKTGERLDFVYLYDLPYLTKDGKTLTPQMIYEGTKDIEGSDFTYVLPAKKKEVVTTIFPWGHYLTSMHSRTLHMPGSYAYLMAYANSIKNNKPWLAVAGANRGVIPNIRSLDITIPEAYMHAFQGDGTYDASQLANMYDVDTFLGRINPIIDFGQGFGNLIFGNRTYFISNGSDTVSFRSFLNVRLLLANIHKAAFASSIQHTFEPNDDIVWLSFKQKVNDLLDQMVSGRGIKWYKWYKLQSDKLGQIKAKLTIRPIEAVESFDIIISMTDEDGDIVATEV